jgi:hypothetical protein
VVTKIRLTETRMPATHRKSVKPPKVTRLDIPGYGLATGKKGLLPWKWAEDRLKKAGSIGSQPLVRMGVHT